MHRKYFLVVPGLALGVLATISMRAGYSNETTTVKGLAGRFSSNKASNINN